MLLYAIMWMMVVVDATLMMLVVLVINIQPLGSLAIRSQSYHRKETLHVTLTH